MHQGKKEIELDGLFIGIGHVAITKYAKELGVRLNDKGEIILQSPVDNDSTRTIILDWYNKK